jgi:RNA polymerase sigma-70 factor (ECF subfamily)
MAERVAGNSRIAGLLGQLSRRDRQVLLLMDDGHTMAEIGEMLGCSAAAVKMRLRRAKNRLKRLIEDEERGEEAGRDADTRQPSR